MILPLKRAHPPKDGAAELRSFPRIPSGLPAGPPATFQAPGSFRPPAASPFPLMSRSLLLPLLLATLAAACSDAVGTPEKPGDTGPVVRWSDRKAWPGGVVPAAGAAVTIPAGRTVLLDVSPPPLASLQVDGNLVFAEQELSLTTGWIVVHGKLEIGSEERPFRSRARILLTASDAGENVMGMGTRMIGVMGGRLEIHGEPRQGWTRLRATAAAGSATLELVDAPAWRAGDRLVVASTDYDPARAEEVVVASVSGRTVTLQAPLRYAHWGELQSFGGRTLDQRAEVGLLTRNITIEGEEGAEVTGFGGHIMVMSGSTAHVQGVELKRMGQGGRQGRYPMHWHMAGDAAGSYLRNSSIWRTQNRCVTLHGTHNVSVERNVCYDHPGHGYFLEDGIETGNTLEGNLGLGTRVPAADRMLLPSDAVPSTFWITHPDNIVRGNVAAGSFGRGFWVALPEHPTGLSQAGGAAVWPRRVALREFSGNVAHSNRREGLHVDDGPRPDGTTEVTSYAPRAVPGSESASVTAVFDGFVGYKHAGRAVWLRGTAHRLSRAMLADNGIGATFASSESFLEDAVVVGVSANNAVPLPGTSPVRGYEFYDGRVGARNVLFVNFRGTPTRPWSALGYQRNNAFAIHPGNSASGLRFENADGVFLEDPRADRDGDKAAVFLDEDGSVTGTAGAYVTANSPILAGPGCSFRAGWNAYVCGGRFVRVNLRDEGGAAIAPLQLRRSDNASVTLVGSGNNPSSVNASVPLGYAYEARFAGAPPARPRLRVDGIRAGEAVRVSFAFTGGAPIVWRDYDRSRPIAAAASLAELDASAGDRYFYDAAAGMLHVRATPRPDRDWATVFADPR